VRDAERARTELDTLAQVVSANLTRAALEAAPVIADLSSWLADIAGKASAVELAHDGFPLNAQASASRWRGDWR
jgi:hypothetical protein